MKAAADEMGKIITKIKLQNWEDITLLEYGALR